MATPERSNGDGDGNDDDRKFGFGRDDMYMQSLAGTVDPYDRHIFLCYKSPNFWPSKVEQDPHTLPSLLSDAILSRRDHIPAKTRLTVCEERYGSESMDGEVLIFPEMIRYRGLGCLEVDKFVEEVLVKGSNWGSAVPEKLFGSHVFVCSHRSRDKRCGHCGPALVEKFNQEVQLRGLKDQVFVRPCSHLGGHQYAGNLIIFSPNFEGTCSGHWYGYVSPNDVGILLDEHIRRGTIVSRLWRGQMGVASNKPGVSQNEPRGCSGARDEASGGGCCSSANNRFSCCKNDISSNGAELSTKRHGRL